MNIRKKTQYGDVHAFMFGYSPFGPPMMSVAMYMVDKVLIDTAQSNMEKSVLEAIRGERLDGVFLTHHHEDHSGNAATLSKAFSIPVYGHPLTRKKMHLGFKIKPYQHLVWGKSSPMEIRSLSESIETEHYNFKAIHTPGHSKDHTVYLEEKNGWLFSGDLYLGDRIKFFRSDERFKEQIDSLRRILEFDFDALFCSHRPCPENGKQRIKRKLDFLENFYGKVQTLYQKGHSDKAIIRELDDKQDRRVKWFTLGNASMANMIRSAVQALQEIQ